MSTEAFQRFLALTTGVREPAALAGIERIMRASVFHRSLDFCSREELIRCAGIAALAWRNRRGA